jgi:hypothetical protein
MIRNSIKTKIENAIKDQLRLEFKNINKEKECDKFIENYVEFKYVNLVRKDESEIPIPVFGIDNITSFFTNKVDAKFWQELKEKCENNDEKGCMELCQQNPFLKSMKNFNDLNEENKNKALNYLKGLKAGSFFSGWIPFFDMGMEYYYRHKFKEECKNLYGYDYETAKEALKEAIKEKAGKMEKKDIEYMNLIENEDKKQKIPQNSEKEEEDSNYSNKRRNFVGFFRGLFDSGSIIIKIIETGGRAILSGGLRTASLVLLPITIAVSGIWSIYNIDSDCNKILFVFERAFCYLKITKTLLTYSDSFQKAIEYLGDIGKKIIDESKKNEEL